MMLASMQTKATADGSRAREDWELTRVATAGDERARREIASRLVEPVRARVSYLAGGGADAEDLAQLALIEILASLGSFRGECSLEPWAKKIATRVAYRQLKKRKRRARLRLSPRFHSLGLAPTCARHKDYFDLAVLFDYIRAER